VWALWRNSGGGLGALQRLQRSGWGGSGAAVRVSMAPKCKWCGKARAHRKSALARIALAFVNGKSDLESSKYQVARVWEGRDGSSSYKE
jgi:hypothetical protein